MTSHIAASQSIDMDEIFTQLAERFDDPPGQQAVIDYVQNYKIRKAPHVTRRSKVWTVSDFQALVKSMPQISDPGDFHPLYVVGWQVESDGDLSITFCNKQLFRDSLARSVGPKTVDWLKTV